MQGRKFFFYLWSIAFILPIFSLHGQVEKTNEKGEKIIEFSDGSTVLYKNEASEEEFPVSFKEKIAKMSDRETRALVLEKLKKAKKDNKNAKKTSREFALKRVKLEKRLKRIAKDKQKSAEITSLKKELKQLRPLEKSAKKTEKLTEKQVSIASNLLDLNNTKRKKALLKIYQSEQKFEPIKSIDTIVIKKDKNKKDKIKNVSTDQTIVTTETKHPTEKQTKTNQVSSINKVFAVYKESEDVLLSPPDTPCALSFSGQDEFTGQARKDVAPRLLFAHTDEELRPYMNGRDYLICQAFLTSLSGGFQFLTLEITIASKNAQREYGLINKGNILTIKTLDGDNVKLQASKSAIGTYDAFQEAYTYKVSYRMSGSSIKQLKKSEVDKVRVVWSSGYVDYDVYEVDFFIDQFDCLKNGK